MKIHQDMADNLVVNILELTAPEMARLNEVSSEWNNQVIGFDLDKGFLQSRIERGLSKAITLEVNGKKSYVFVFCIDDAKILHIQSMICIEPNLKLLDVMKWIRDNFAPALKVSAVMFDTKSAAMYRLARSIGMLPVGVSVIWKI